MALLSSISESIEHLNLQLNYIIHFTFTAITILDFILNTIELPDQNLCNYNVDFNRKNVSVNI